MANLTISNGNKSIDTKGLQVRELKAGLSLEQAIEKTSGNGVDETFVEAEGKKYVIFSEDNLSIDSKASIQIDGKAAKVLKSTNEINSFGEGLAFVPVKGYKVAKAVLAPIVPNPATGLAITGGLISGAISRNAISPFAGNSAMDVLPYLLAGTTGLAGLAAGGYGAGKLDGNGLGILAGAGFGAAFSGAMGGYIGDSLINNSGRSQTTGIGIGLGAIAAVSIVTAAADQDSKSPATRQLKAWATGVGSVGLGAASPELLKLAAQIQIPEVVLKGAKIAGTAALVGGAMATLGLATAGALKNADTKSLDEISK